MLITESKKDTISNKLKSKFPQISSFIQMQLDKDPTGYKYLDYLSNILEKMIPQIQDLNKVTIGDLAQISALTDVVPSFHELSDRIKKEDIEETNKVFGIDIDKILRDPKDIKQYTNPRFLKNVLELVKIRKTDKDVRSGFKKTAVKLYEDDDVLVMSPKSIEASCYYGANTRWCTASKEKPETFKDYSEKGNLYYFIKKKENLKFALYKEKYSNNYKVYDSDDQEISIYLLTKKFPNQVELIENLIGDLSFLETIRYYAKGKINDKSELYDSEKMLDYVESEDPKSSTELTFEFEDDKDFFETMGFLSDDDIWVESMVNSRYHTYDNYIVTYDNIENEALEGYLFGYFNEENEKLFKKIAMIISPGTELEMVAGDNNLTKITKKLLNYREFQWMIGEIADIFEEKAIKQAQSLIAYEIDDFVKKIGFTFDRNYDRVTTTISNLISHSIVLRIEKSDFKSLFNQICEFNQKGTRIGHWSDTLHDWVIDDNQISKLNEVVNEKLNKILDEILENPREEFEDTWRDVIKKYKTGIIYNLPKNPKSKFRIHEYDIENNKIDIDYWDSKNVEKKELKLSKEQFNLLLHQPELF